MFISSCYNLSPLKTVEGYRLIFLQFKGISYYLHITLIFNYSPKNTEYL